MTNITNYTTAQTKPVGAIPVTVTLPPPLPLLSSPLSGVGSQGTHPSGFIAKDQGFRAFREFRDSPVLLAATPCPLSHRSRRTKRTPKKLKIENKKFLKHGARTPNRILLLHCHTKANTRAQPPQCTPFLPIWLFAISLTQSQRLSPLVRTIYFDPIETRSPGWISNHPATSRRLRNQGRRPATLIHCPTSSLGDINTIT
ncbi:hypothetical protein F5Y19DRAFT_237291 [Xylariaceae sp. FL1651]|nr:hypothetical protein F5Y19DRAFT_237291 [Xylariaceae sp. FL1651]